MFESVNEVATRSHTVPDTEGTHMTSTSTKSAKAPVAKTANPDYRVLVRILAAKAGWKGSQTASFTDLFTKGDTKVALHYSKGQVVTSGEVIKGDSHAPLFTKSSDKFPQALSYLLGKPWKGTLVSQFKNHQAQLASGKGVALIKEIATKAPATKAPASKATKAPAKATKAPAKAPVVTGPTNQERQAIKDQEHISQM